jgi:flagellar motor switch protein FliN/FliY
MKTYKNKGGRIKEIKVPLEVVIGRCELPLAQFAEMGESTIIELNSLAGEPVEVVAAGEVIAKGEVVVIDENFGVRIIKILDGRE